GEPSVRRRTLGLSHRIDARSVVRIYSSRLSNDGRGPDWARRICLHRTKSHDSVDGPETLQDQTVYSWNIEQFPRFHLKKRDFPGTDNFLPGRIALRCADRWYPS